MSPLHSRIKKKIFEERRSDEASLYHIIERDLDRGAIFEEHDGWYSQVSFGKGKRIDYVTKYGDEIYGIEVKKDFPRIEHLKQAERYRNALNGIFLAYPSDRVGEAIYHSERNESFRDIGFISIALFRSHVIRKAKSYERNSEQIWKDLFDDKEYLDSIRTSPWENDDRLAATILNDGCFWVSFTTRYEESEDLHRLSLSKSDWKGLGVLYGASLSTSLHKFFSVNDLDEFFYKDLGWKGIFDLGKLVQCDLVSERGYGYLFSVFSLSQRAIFLRGELEKALKEHLGEKDYTKLKIKIDEWRKRHREKQSTLLKEFIG